MKRLLLLAPFIIVNTYVWSQQLETLAPSTFIAGKAFPVVVEATLQNQLDLFRSENIGVSITGGQLPSSVLKLKKGRSMTTFQSEETANAISISGQGISISVAENLEQEEVHNGALTGNMVWQSGTVHRINSDLWVNVGDSLIIESGCWVLLDSAINVVIDGVLEVHGSQANPVTFCSSNSASWGGVISAQGTVNLEYCLLNNGGGDFTRSYGHSGSQAVLKSEPGLVHANHTFVFDCVGKGLGGADGIIEFRNGGVSRCDMGGEFGSTHTLISRSHVLDIPDDDGLLEDDDNDGFYFSGFTPLPSTVDSCVFMFGEDDAIDHNGAVLEVRNTWVENFEHEGIAASNGNSVQVYNSLFKNCEQGIEAGYGSPEVTINHCVMVDNDYGLRFGDWYNWGCSGTISCINSIMFNNGDNVYNYDVLTDGPVIDAIDLTFSIANDLEYDGNTGCLSGTPTFTNTYQLEPGSLGIGAANDGFNMGLISPFSTGIFNPLLDRDLPIQSVRVFDLNGKLVFSKANDQYEQDFQNLNNGIYIVEEDFGTYLNRTKRIVLR